MNVSRSETRCILQNTTCKKVAVLEVNEDCGTNKITRGRAGGDRDNVEVFSESGHNGKD